MFPLPRLFTYSVKAITIYVFMRSHVYAAEREFWQNSLFSVIHERAQVRANTLCIEVNI